MQRSKLMDTSSRARPTFGFSLNGLAIASRKAATHAAFSSSACVGQSRITEACMNH